MNDLKPIQTREHHRLIEAILDAHGFPADTLVLVPSVFDWAHQHGIDEMNPFRCGMAVHSSTGSPHVVLSEVITPDMQSSVVSALERHFGKRALPLLESHEAFVAHLSLHEMWHLLNPDSGEQENDCRAFSVLNAWVAIS